MDNSVAYYFPYGTSGISRNKTSFLTPHEIVEIKVNEKLIRRLLGLVDGQKKWSEVTKYLSEWNSRTIDSFCNHLVDLGILVDARRIGSSILAYTNNPSYFTTENFSDEKALAFAIKARDIHRTEATKELSLRKRVEVIHSSFSERRSNRSFGNVSVSAKDISSLLWHAYGITLSDGIDHRVVPSAGALFPLAIHLVLLKDTDELDQGIYKVEYPEVNEVGFVRLESESLILKERIFIDPMTVHNATGYIVISSDLDLAELKYGPRSLRYALIESGHVAQNIGLAASALGVQLVEIGGFFEAAVKGLLMSENQPLITCVFGSQPEGTLDDPIKRPQSMSVQWSPYNSMAPYQLPFTMAFARSNDLGDEQGWSCGRSKNPQLALLKASVEAQEWLACGLVDPRVQSGSFNQISNAINPKDVIKFHPNQYRLKNFPYVKFADDMICEWKEVQDYSNGESSYVMCDQIYFPYRPATERGLCYGANSSGCAAHTSLELACQGAALEIVERDAFMITWVNQLLTPTIKKDSLPEYLQRRISSIEEQGFEVAVKDISLDLAPVVLIIAQNKKMTYTTVAAASSFDREEMIDHALMEVESSIYCRYVYGKSKKVSVGSIDKTEDHGKLYEVQEYYQKADCYFLKNKDIAMSEIGNSLSANSWCEFIDNLKKRGLRMHFADLSAKSHAGIRSDLHIVKCIIPGIIPMSFGYREEPLGMPRIYQLPVSLGLTCRPLMDRNLVKFPHPFT